MATAPRKVVFPAAGFGTRLLPATTAFPKELLPLVDRPIIQYGVEEAVRADMRQVILVTNPGNTMTAAHFEPHPELEALLGERGKTELLAAVRALSAMATIVPSVPNFWGILSVGRALCLIMMCLISGAASGGLRCH